MIQEYGDMFSSSSDLYVVTTNNIISEGRLVMGRGAALSVKNKFPGVDIAAAKKISFSLPRYGFQIIPGYPVGIFQVKYHWRRSARIDLIRFSTSMLGQFARFSPSLQIALNFPGIGADDLFLEDVLPIISALPDNVHVWRF